MSDNRTPCKQAAALLCQARRHEGYRPCGFCVVQMETYFRLPQPPIPRISEEEIQLLTGKLYIGLVNEPIYTWHEKCAAILRTLNEEKKA